MSLSPSLLSTWLADGYLLAMSSHGLFSGCVVFKFFLFIWTSYINEGPPPKTHVNLITSIKTLSPYVVSF